MTHTPTNRIEQAGVRLVARIGHRIVAHYLAYGPRDEVTR